MGITVITVLSFKTLSLGPLLPSMSAVRRAQVTAGRNAYRLRRDGGGDSQLEETSLCQSVRQVGLDEAISHVDSALHEDEL